MYCLHTAVPCAGLACSRKKSLLSEAHNIYPMQMMIKHLLLNLLLLTPLVACASSTTLDRVLNEKTAPPGVVIEIVTGDAQGLNWALPEAKSDIKQLRARFPGLPIAIVTHGREQFALQKKKRKQQRKVHLLTQSLLKEDVQLHVCGTFAGWEGLAAEDFPDYVNVAPAGPAQVDDYIAMGYQLIIIKRRDAK